MDADRIDMIGIKLNAIFDLVKFRNQGTQKTYFHHLVQRLKRMPRFGHDF